MCISKKNDGKHDEKATKILGLLSTTIFWVKNVNFEQMLVKKSTVSTVSLAERDRVSESWFIVVLNEMYLNSLSQAKKTIKATMKLY